jgi:hypothetical protein
MTVNRPAIWRPPRVPANKALILDVDARVGEGGRQPFGEVLQLVGGFGARAGGQVQVVQLIDQDEIDVDVRGTDRVDDVSDVEPGGEVQAEEPGELHGEHLRRGGRRDGDVEDREPGAIVWVALADSDLVGGARDADRDRRLDRAADDRRTVGKLTS